MGAANQLLSSQPYEWALLNRGHESTTCVGKLTDYMFWTQSKKKKRIKEIEKNSTNRMDILYT